MNNSKKEESLIVDISCDDLEIMTYLTTPIYLPIKNSSEKEKPIESRFISYFLKIL